MIQVASAHEHGDNMSPMYETRDLRWIAAAFESAQAQRLRTGEQIRATLPLRSGSIGGQPRGMSEVEVLLARLRSGGAPTTLVALGDTYRRQWNEERDLLRVLTERIARHPAWPWLERVHGLGPSLAARLLARLDIERAPTPSSFWSYCGLATVAAQLYRCDECGYELSLPAGRSRHR